MVHPLFWEISLLFNLQRQEVQVLHDGKILKEGHALVEKDTIYQQDFPQMKKSKANSKIQHLCTFSGNLMWLSDRNWAVQMHVLENISTASSTSVHGLGGIPVRLSMVLFILVALRRKARVSE